MKAVTSSSALALLFALGLVMGPTVAQAAGDDMEHVGQTEQEQYAGSAVCDADGNGRVTDWEAEQCAEQGWTGWTEDEESMTEEQFSEAFPEAQDTQTLFSEVDTDGDGEISRAEWSDWHDESYAESEFGEEGMPTSDYEAWYGSGMTE